MTTDCKSNVVEFGAEGKHCHFDSSPKQPPPCTNLPTGLRDCLLNYRDLASVKAACTQCKCVVKSLLHGNDAAPDDEDDPFDIDQYEECDNYDEEFSVHAPRRFGNGACCSTTLVVSGSSEPGCTCFR